MAEDRLYPSPRNAVREPYGKDRKFGRSVRIAVVARLVWPSKTTIVPATVVWISDDRVCVEWLPRPRILDHKANLAAQGRCARSAHLSVVDPPR